MKSRDLTVKKFIESADFRNAYIYEEDGKTLYGGLLDPLFWRELGQSLVWRDTVTRSYMIHHKHGANFQDVTICSGGDLLEGYIPEWRYHWHRFIDHLASGGDPESFFTNLLK